MHDRHATFTYQYILWNAEENHDTFFVSGMKYICIYTFQYLFNKPLAPHRCRLESCQGLWIHSCEGAIQLLHMCPLMPEIMESRHMISSTVLMRRKTQSKCLYSSKTRRSRHSKNPQFIGTRLKLP
jgi:hypothetical protein